MEYEKKKKKKIGRTRLFRERIETTEGVDDLLSSPREREEPPFVPCPWPRSSWSTESKTEPLYPFILFRIDSISPVGRKPSRDRESNEDQSPGTVVIPRI